MHIESEGETVSVNGYITSPDAAREQERPVYVC